MTGASDTLEQLRRAIDELAGAEVAEIVGEARAEARAKVRAILAEAIAERMLERAEGELQPGEPPYRGALAQPPTLTESESVPRGRPAPPEPSGRPPGSRRTPDRDEQEDDDRPAAQPQDREREEPVPAGESGLYLYGVVAADAELAPASGIDAVNDISLVRAEAIAAVASPVALQEFGEHALSERLEDLEWLEEHARRHEHILEVVREQTTLVPMRLCTIYRDAASVREMLAREHEFLADALGRLRGRTEWGVKLYLLDPEAATGGEAEELAGEAGSGAGYLMRRSESQHRRRRSEAAVEQCCARVHARLAEAAVEAKVNSLQPAELSERSEPMVFNGVYLVEDELLQGFVALQDTLQRELAGEGFALELTGPWPAYNFVNSPAEIGR